MEESLVTSGIFNNANIVKDFEEQFLDFIEENKQELQEFFDKKLKKAEEKKRTNQEVQIKIMSKINYENDGTVNVINFDSANTPLHRYDLTSKALLISLYGIDSIHDKIPKKPQNIDGHFHYLKISDTPSSSQLIIKVGSFITLSQYQAFTNIKNLCDERVKIKIASDAITNHSLYSIGENFLSFLVEDRKLTVFVNKTQPNFETYELNLRKTGQIEIGTKSLQEIHIGRSKKSDILLKGLTVSKIHASIVFQNN